MKVELKALTKTFASRKRAPVTAVNSIDLTAPDGKLIALLGPSGCGKSTTLDMICGLTKPTSGSIFFDDTDVTELPPEKRGVGMVFQNYALYPHMTVQENIRFPLENFKGANKLSRAEANKRVLEAAQLVQIEPFLSRRPIELSGGQQQRVAIARALVKMPKVLLLDEPLSNLDARLRLQTREEIRRIQKQTGITTLFVTHDQEEAMSISDLIVVMNNGNILQVGMPQEVYDDPANLFVAEFLGSPRINTFDGEVSGGGIYIGKEKVANAKLPDGKVTVGIRPEGLIPDENGALSLKYRRTEVLGRDIIVMCGHNNGKSGIIRAICTSRTVKNENGIVRFDPDPAKMYIFDKANGKRLI